MSETLVSIHPKEAFIHSDDDKYYDDKDLFSATLLKKTLHERDVNQKFRKYIEEIIGIKPLNYSNGRHIIQFIFNTYSIFKLREELNIFLHKSQFYVRLFLYDRVKPTCIMKPMSYRDRHIGEYLRSREDFFIWCVCQNLVRKDFIQINSKRKKEMKIVSFLKKKIKILN